MRPVARAWVPAASSRVVAERPWSWASMAVSCGVVAATGSTSGGRLRKAMPRPTTMRMGKMKIQKMASGSRKKSRKRAVVSW